MIRLCLPWIAVSPLSGREDTRQKRRKHKKEHKKKKNVAGGAKWPDGVTCWDGLRGVYGGKGCCKWNPPSVRRLCCCHRLIKAVNKYTQTCRRTFLGGVLAHSPLPRPPAGLEQDVSRGAAPDIPVGELKYREFSLLRSTLLGRPGICTKRKGLSDRWGISQQAEPNLFSVAVKGAQNLHKPDSEMHSRSQLFEDLTKRYDYGVRCLNSRNVSDAGVCQTLSRSDVNTLGSKGPTFFFFFFLIEKIYPLYIWYFWVNKYNFSKILNDCSSLPTPQIHRSHELNHPACACSLLLSGFQGIFSQLGESWTVPNFLMNSSLSPFTLFYHSQLCPFHSLICVHMLQK